MNDIFILKRINVDNSDLFFSSFNTLETGIANMLDVSKQNIQIGVCPLEERITSEHGYNVHVRGKPFGFVFRFCVDLFQGDSDGA